MDNLDREAADTELPAISAGLPSSHNRLSPQSLSHYWRSDTPRDRLAQELGVEAVTLGFPAFTVRPTPITAPSLGRVLSALLRSRYPLCGSMNWNG